jgi:hypothetical protein
MLIATNPLDRKELATKPVGEKHFCPAENSVICAFEISSIHQQSRI